MQVLKETLFYSNFRPCLEVEDDDDRELLVQEQKSCRARARKFSSETNRRRKVLEERRRQWDVQEQRLREKILQQRKQRVQDATERFQRAHLPLSQRRRPGPGLDSPARVLSVWSLHVLPVSPCFLWVLRFPSTVQRHAVRSVGHVKLPLGVSVCVIVSFCLSCDELATCPGCFLPSAR
uniref:Uncharacterized protein n=1 Tax=Pygocentrus nattereri TaxID=42514 RepID=A0AAR2LMF3_PYGNA